MDIGQINVAKEAMWNLWCIIAEAMNDSSLTEEQIIKRILSLAKMFRRALREEEFADYSNKLVYSIMTDAVGTAKMIRECFEGKNKLLIPIVEN